MRPFGEASWRGCLHLPCMNAGIVPEMDSLMASFAASGVVAVITLDDAGHAERTAEALLAGGIGVVELTLRTPAGMEALRRMSRAFPGMVVGAGTVLRPEQVVEARDAGARFGVAPGFNPRVVKAAREEGLPFAPGVFSPSEIEAAVEAGCRVLKYFPASTGGDAAHFQTVTVPYAHLGLRYIPLGGISMATAGGFLAQPGVVAVGGSWIAPRAVLASGDWVRVEANARAAHEMSLATRKARTP